MDAAARLRLFCLWRLGKLHPRLAWIYWRAPGMVASVTTSLDHCVAVVQYLSVWHGFAPRG